MRRSEDEKSEGRRSAQRRRFCRFSMDGQALGRRLRRTLPSVVGIVLASLSAGACDSVTGRDDTILSLTLNARFVYRGKTQIERLPFECRKRYDFSGPYLHTYPLYQSARMPDGSAIVFGLNGLCEYLTSRDGPDIDLQPREGLPGASQVLSRPLAIPPLNTTWLSEPRRPRIIDVYLVNDAQREEVGGYRPLGFSVQASPPHTGNLEAASRRVAPAAWGSSWPPTWGYCGGTTTTLDFEGPVMDSISLPRGAYYSPERRPNLLESARPVLYHNGTWRAFAGESHVIRLHRKDTVKVQPYFYFGSKSLPFEHDGTAQRHNGVTVNIRCPSLF